MQIRGEPIAVKPPGVSPRELLPLRREDREIAKPEYLPENYRLLGDLKSRRCLFSGIGHPDHFVDPFFILSGAGI